MTEINALIDKMERAVIDYEIKPTEKGRQLAEQAERAIREYVAPLEKRVAELEGALRLISTTYIDFETKFTRTVIEIAHKALEPK